MKYLPIRHELSEEQIKNTKALIDALRSGSYRQGTKKLKYIDDEDEVCHCCLGVASEILGCENRVTSLGVFRFIYPDDDLTNHADIPNDRWWMREYGWDCSNIQISGGDSKALYDMNDGGWKFEEISDLLEAIIIKKEEFDFYK